MTQVNLRAADDAVLKKYFKILKSPNIKTPLEFNTHNQFKGRAKLQETYTV
jgi:hypothetical protein